MTSRALGAHEPISEPIADVNAPSVVSALLAETTGLLRNFVLTITAGPAAKAGSSNGSAAVGSIHFSIYVRY